MEAAASVVGIVSFGLGLAKSLQAFIDSVIEAEETITLVLAEVNATASTLERLQEIIDKDKTASQDKNRPTVFNNAGIKEIHTCALLCQKIYVQIIILIERASMQNGEDDRDDNGPQGPAADDQDGLKKRLDVFSQNVTKLGRKMRWPWLEPRIKRCQEHLGRLKVSLMLSLQVFFIAESRARPSVARIFGTDEEGELRDRAEVLRKKMAELQAKKSPRKQSNRPPPPGSDDGASEVINTTSRANSVSTTSVNSSGTMDSRCTSSYATSSSLGSERRHRSRKTRKSRTSRALRALRTFKVQFRRRLERKSVFKKDSRSVMLEAYLIYPIPGPFPQNSSPPPIKLPFGHRRLTREVKRALRKFNPWDILLMLSPHHRYLVDRVVKRVQRAADGTSHVCLVAIDVDGHVDVDGHSDANMSDLEAGDLVWTTMVLFFRHEPVNAQRGTTEDESDISGETSRLMTTMRRLRLFSSRPKRRLDMEVSSSEDESSSEAEEQQQQQELKEKIETKIAKRNADAREKRGMLEQEQRRRMLEHEEQIRRAKSQEHMRRQQERDYGRRQREDYIRAEVARRLQQREDERLREERLREEREEEQERREQEFKDRVEAEVLKRDAVRRDREEKAHILQQKQIEHDRRVADEARSQLLEKQRQEEEDERRLRFRGRR